MMKTIHNFIIEKLSLGKDTQANGYMTFNDIKQIYHMTEMVGYPHNNHWYSKHYTIDKAYYETLIDWCLDNASNWENNEDLMDILKEYQIEDQIIVKVFKNEINFIIIIYDNKEDLRNSLPYNMIEISMTQPTLSLYAKNSKSKKAQPRAYYENLVCTVIEYILSRK